MSRKSWLKIVLRCDPVLVDPLCDFLLGVVGGGVETGARDEKNWGTVSCYVEDPDLTREAVEEIIQKVSRYLHELAAIFSVEVPAFHLETLGDEDWAKNWKVHFKPFAIIPGLIVSPTWEEYEAAPGEKVIVMDPGMAFGTGHHATTSLSLEMLYGVITQQEGARLLDIGTGTGILGMAGAHFGAARVLGIDNDPEAVSIAAQNIVRNGMQGIMRVSREPLEEVKGLFTVVVANIVHDVLASMAEDIERVTEKGGSLILSGLLHGEQTEKIIQLYGRHGFSLEEELVRQDWAALRFSNR
jgi:ribosomal protein L11 methyltransferase